MCSTCGIWVPVQIKCSQANREYPWDQVTVEIVGGKLKATVPGQPVYTLLPVAANRFSIEGAPSGFFVQFEMAEGKVKSLTLIQGSAPNLVLLPMQ